jgi:hypothetical protein
LANPSLQSSKELVLIAVKYNGELLKQVEEQFKNDREVVFQAVK